MQWHQLDHMQTICTTLQTDNHTNPSSLNFTGRILFLTPNQQCQSTEDVSFTSCFCTQPKPSLCSASYVGCQHDTARICAGACCTAHLQLVRDTGARGYRSISPTHMALKPSANQQQTLSTPLLLSIDGTDRRTDARP